MNSQMLALFRKMKSISLEFHRVPLPRFFKYGNVRILNFVRDMVELRKEAEKIEDSEDKTEFLRIVNKAIKYYKKYCRGAIE